MKNNANQLIKTLKDKFIVCPLPVYWNKIYQIIIKSNNGNIDIKNPLILGGWGASDKEKSDRFHYHLSIAEDMDVLPEVIRYITSLGRDAFLYSKELKSGSSLNEVGYWDLFEDDIYKVRSAISPGIKIVQKIQKISPDITDDDMLYHLFRRYGFCEENAPNIRDKNSVLLELLTELNNIFEKQRSLSEGSKNLEDFCFKLYNIKG